MSSISSWNCNTLSSSILTCLHCQWDTGRDYLCWLKVLFSCWNMPEIARKEYSRTHWGWNLRCIIPRICRTSFCDLNVKKLINLTFYSMVFIVWRVKMQVSLLVYIVTVSLFLMHRNILLYRVWWNIHNLSMFKVSHPWFQTSYIVMKLTNPESDHKGNRTQMWHVLHHETRNAELN